MVSSPGGQLAGQPPGSEPTYLEVLQPAGFIDVGHRRLFDGGVVSDASRDHDEQTRKHPAFLSKETL